MHARVRFLVSAIAISMLLAACTGSGATPAREGTGRAAPSGPQGNLRIAWRLEPDSLGPKFTTGAGAPDFFWVFNSFLTYRDFTGVPHPLIVESIPTQENGAWMVSPDGTMTTTFRIRETAHWHDMTPITAADYVFGYLVHADQDIPVVNREIESFISAVEEKDDRTIVVHWNRLYILGNVLGWQDLVPLPRHLLENKYRANKPLFTQGEEWTAGYVGTGPFRVERWNPGAGLIGARSPRLGARLAEGRDAREPLHLRGQRDPGELARRRD
jgi:ABC-type transport system substrate-binding protein